VVGRLTQGHHARSSRKVIIEGHARPLPLGTVTPEKSDRNEINRQSA
jgi:hypothetical protein